jgi:hypothetical protein
MDAHDDELRRFEATGARHCRSRTIWVISKMTGPESGIALTALARL